MKLPARAVRPTFVALMFLVLSCSGPRQQVPEPGRPARASDPSSAALTFAIKEGRTDNLFFRKGRVAAHLLATSGDTPRIVVAFPAGNMGIGLWFDGAAELSVEGALSGVERPDRMRGVSATIRARAPRLHVKRALLASVRVLRDAGRDGAVPPQIENEIFKGPTIVLRRTTLDRGHHLELGLEAADGASANVDPDGGIVLTAKTGGDIVVRLTALTDEEPLTPIAPSAIVTADAADDPRALSALTFLTYEEKLLAGSWQYLTYFGRDTLLSTRLLMPVLQPAVIEAGLGAVIERLRADGDVAHEEDIGEWVASQNLARSPRPSNLRQPAYDYKMVDDDFLLAPVLAAYVLDAESGPRRAATFLARRTTGGRTYGEAVRSNLDRVLAQAAPFAARPTQETLVRIGEGLPVGNWRDSTEGLGRGRVPYDVNAALVPAALHAAARLYATESFGRDLAASARAGELARAWAKAEPLFAVKIEAEEARRRVLAYGAEQGIDTREAIAAITGPVSFPAVSLDAKGAPVPIQNSDDGFVMLFTEPSAEWLASAARRILDPFPAGLRTPIGIVVANPAYATDPALRALFTRDHYHGTVVWSWQQAMLLSGLRRQLARADLRTEANAKARRAVADAEQALVRVIEATKAMRTSELWSFSVDGGGFHVVPFGQGRGHHTEANAVQLWSTVYLALDRPAASH